LETREKVMKIMIVEDNDRMRGTLRRIMSTVSPDICECPSGEEAVARYSALSPDVVLMDIRMTGIDGIEATRQIIEQDRGAHIIIVTEHDEDFFREDAKNAGAREYFLKDSLLELRKYLETFVRNPWNSN